MDIWTIQLRSAAQSLNEVTVDFSESTEDASQTSNMSWSEFESNARVLASLMQGDSQVLLALECEVIGSPLQEPIYWACIQSSPIRLMGAVHTPLLDQLLLRVQAMGAQAAVVTHHNRQPLLKMDSAQAQLLLNWVDQTHTADPAPRLPWQVKLKWLLLGPIQLRTLRLAVCVTLLVGASIGLLLGRHHMQMQHEAAEQQFKSVQQLHARKAEIENRSKSDQILWDSWRTTLQSLSGRVDRAAVQSLSWSWSEKSDWLVQVHLTAPPAGLEPIAEGGSSEWPEGCQKNHAALITCVLPRQVRASGFSVPLLDKEAHGRDE